MSLTALQEILSDAKTHRPEMSKEISVIEKALRDVDVNNHVKRFSDLDLVVDNFIADADSEPSNTPNTDRLNRLKNIKNALNVYRNEYATYAADLIAKKGN